MIRPTTPIERTARKKRWLFTWKKWMMSQTSGGASPLSLLLVLSFGAVLRCHPHHSAHFWNDLFIVALVLFCYACMYCWKKQPGRYIPLLFNEAVVLRHYLSPGLESRFTCQSQEDLPHILHHLRQRVTQIALVNPWLCGYLKTHYGVPSIWVDEATDVMRLFHEIRVEDPNDLEQVLMQRTSVEVGANILNTNKPFVKICVVYSPKSPDYYVTVCVTHMVGEPNLLYKLWGMLAPDVPVVPLWADRQHSYKKHPLTALKGAARRKFLYYFFLSKASLFRTLLFGHRHSKDASQPIINRRYVNMEWVQAQKDAYQQQRSKNKDENVPHFISTQDVLTTWFFSQLKPSCVCVAYSLHNRVENVTLQHMGNYLDALVLYPDEYTNPGHVRRAIASMGEWAPAFNHPGQNDYSAGLVTGWHSRFVDLELPRSVRQTHLPLRGAMFTGMIPRVLPCMCLFRTSQNQYAVLTLSRDELLDTSALGRPVAV